MTEINYWAQLMTIRLDKLRVKVAQWSEVADKLAIAGYHSHNCAIESDQVCDCEWGRAFSAYRKLLEEEL